MILNRVLKWVDNGMECRADDKHVKENLKEIGLNEGPKGLDVPIMKETEIEKGAEEDAMDAHEAMRFRQLERTICRWTDPTSSSRRRRSAGTWQSLLSAA